MQMLTQSIEDFKNKVIEAGIASVNTHEKREERIKGCLAGLERCRALNSMADFEECIARCHENERAMIQSGAAHTDPKLYWEVRCETAQVEFVFERMKVIWKQLGLYSGPLSAHAILQAARILDSE